MENETNYPEILFKKNKPKFIIIKSLPLCITCQDMYTLLEHYCIDVS